MASALVERLCALGVPCADAEAVSEVVQSSLEQALAHLGRQPDGTVQSHLNQWKEFYSMEHSRLYYCNDPIGYNSWHAPPCFKFQEWRLDAGLYPGLSISKARDIYLTLDSVLTRHPPPLVASALRVLSKLVGNVADCNNAVEKYRDVKVTNPAFQEAVWNVPGASDILLLLGWRRQGEVLALPADAPLGPIQAAAARLRRLADRKGHSGSAVLVQPGGEGGSARPQSEYYGRPGFLYQEQIWHCGNPSCGRPINDGSERLWTGRHDAPLGEYRYNCTTCSHPFNLCQDCWDAFQAGQALHPRDHHFQHVGPRMSRHNDYYHADSEGSSGDPGNPWGARRGGGGAYARALQRLGQRYGIRDWG